MRVNLPNLLLVDPRAYSKNIPSIVLSGPRYMLACLRGANFTFDIYSKNAIDSVFNGVKLVEGDMTSSVILSGTTEQVSALLNSNNGTRLTGIRGPVGGFYAVYNFVAMNMPSLDPEFCSQGSGANTRAIYLRPLGLGMALIKNGVKLRP
ncbi:unannotated protein [freshwater metagenome]|uniref:Unannotated protein n=1 Tax=freshwater metagenome TaxID=449393 RepID=A0A6J5ZQU2_9ZZZZ|nr:hypothetical protein [Actinomycetota bacterium]MSV64448.1 hypothetical protein [Actinomycetota bacterium]MSW26326.1 hypothetical protein [Actinomycetota bacterium]MSW34643.1 hypothetical protein [Actinomycetota bacterium]MSX31669.1 hypothetical protein [Actinomycetota bacterium]